MKQNGRRSSAALAVARPVEIVERIKPPHDLNDEETEIWSAVVSAEAADWFSPSSAPVLAQFCRHAVHARRIAELLERATSDPMLTVDDYDKLLHMQDRESKAIASLAVKMRIVQQSTTNHRGNKRPSPVIKPWDGG
jgi:hypothetical protein